MVHKLIVVVLFILLFLRGNSQQAKGVEHYIDSIKGIIDTTQSDYIKSKMIYNYAWYYNRFGVPDSSLVYAKQVLKHAKTNNYQDLVGKSVIVISAIYATNLEYDSATKYLKTNYDYLNKTMETSVNSSSLTKISSILAYIQTEQGLYENAYQTLHECTETFQRIGDSTAAFFSLMTEANFFNKLKIYDRSLIILNEAESLYGKMQDFNVEDLWMKQASVYSFLDKTDLAKQKLFDAIKGLKVEDSYYKSGLGTAYGNLGSLYAKLNKLDSAIYYNKLAIDVFEGLSTANQATSVKLNIVSLYVGEKNYTEANKVFYAIKEIAPPLRGQYYFLKAKLLASTSSSKTSLYFDTALLYAKQYGDVVLQKNIYNELYELNKSNGNALKSLNYHEQYVIVKDSIFNKEKSLAIQKVIVQKVIDDKNQEITLNELEYEKDIEKRNKQYWILFSVLIAIFGLTVIFYLRSRLAKKKVELKAKENELLLQENEQVKSELEHISFEWDRSKVFLSQTKDQLKQIRLSDKKDQAINSLLVTTNQYVKKEEEKTEFQERIKEIKNTFFDRLDEIGKLTKTEKKVAALLKLSLSSKEIAEIQNVEEKTIEIYRSRLRKKLVIPASVDLPSYFNSL